MPTTRKAPAKKAQAKGSAAPKRSGTIGTARKRGTKSALKKTKGRASAPKSSHEASHKTGQTAVAQRRSQARAVARKKTPTKGKGLNQGAGTRRRAVEGVPA